MQVYINRPQRGIFAKAEYNLVTKECLVLEGSVVSKEIAYSTKFRGAASIEKARNGVIKNNVLMKDILFKSASTAANFVTGSSTNGLVAWKTAEGKTLKDLIEEENNE